MDYKNHLALLKGLLERADTPERVELVKNAVRCVKGVYLMQSYEAYVLKHEFGELLEGLTALQAKHEKILNNNPEIRNLQKRREAIMKQNEYGSFHYRNHYDDHGYSNKQDYLFKTAERLGVDRSKCIEIVEKFYEFDDMSHAIHEIYEEMMKDLYKQITIIETCDKTMARRSAVSNIVERIGQIKIAAKEIVMNTCRERLFNCAEAYQTVRASLTMLKKENFEPYSHGEIATYVLGFKGKPNSYDHYDGQKEMKTYDTACRFMKYKFEFEIWEIVARTQSEKYKDLEDVKESAFVGRIENFLHINRNGAPRSRYDRIKAIHDAVVARVDLFEPVDQTKIEAIERSEAEWREMQEAKKARIKTDMAAQKKAVLQELKDDGVFRNMPIALEDKSGSATPTSKRHRLAINEKTLIEKV